MNTYQQNIRTAFYGDLRKSCNPKQIPHRVKASTQKRLARMAKYMAAS